MSLDEELVFRDVVNDQRTEGLHQIAVTGMLRDATPRLHSYFQRRLNVLADADDCVVDVLASIWRRQDEAPEAGASFDVWMFAIARGVLSNHRRTEARQHGLLTRLISVYERPDNGDGLPGSIDVAGIRSALQVLSERDRELVMLVAWDGLGVQEAGASLGLAAGTARTRYSRARTRLRQALESRDGKRAPRTPGGLGRQTTDAQRRETL